MRAELLFSLIRSLAKARELKHEMRRKKRGPCFSHSEHCSCTKEELCNLALAAALARDASNVHKQLRRAQKLLPEVILSRRADVATIYPRRYYRLAEDWERALVHAMLEGSAETEVPALGGANQVRP